MKTTNSPLMLAALAGLTLAAGSAQAALIYQDDFSGAGSSNLAGTTPDTTTGAATWTASTDWKDNGAVAVGTDDEDNAFLAFTPMTGSIYKLSASLATPAGGGGAWAGIGFTDTNTTTNALWQNDASPWVLYRASTQVVSYTLRANAVGKESHANFAGPLELSIVLDTTNAADWTAEWFVNGSSVRSAVSVGTPSINHVGLGRSDGTGADFSSFKLETIPEPSTTALLGLGVLGLLRRRRK